LLSDADADAAAFDQPIDKPSNAHHAKLNLIAALEIEIHSRNIEKGHNKHIDVNSYRERRIAT